MSEIKYMTYLGFATTNAGFMVLIDSYIHHMAFGTIALVYCAFATKTLHEDKDE